MDSSGFSCANKSRPEDSFLGLNACLSFLYFGSFPPISHFVFLKLY